MILQRHCHYSAVCFACSSSCLVIPSKSLLHRYNIITIVVAMATEKVKKNFELNDLFPSYTLHRKRQTPVQNNKIRPPANCSLLLGCVKLYLTNKPIFSSICPCFCTSNNFKKSHFLTKVKRDRFLSCYPSLNQREYMSISKTCLFLAVAKIFERFLIHTNFFIEFGNHGIFSIELL